MPTVVVIGEHTTYLDDTMRNYSRYWKENCGCTNVEIREVGVLSLSKVSTWRFMDEDDDGPPRGIRGIRVVDDR